MNKITKNRDGKYPHYASDGNHKQSSAYKHIAEEASKYIIAIVKRWREDPTFSKSALNYALRRACIMITGHLERNENMHYEISERAQILADSQDGVLYRGQCIIEHPVPMKVINQKIIEEAKEPEDCVRILRRWSRITIVTKEEDTELNRKYRTSMPEDWDGEDVWARYRKMGIKVLCEDYEE
jgi:hypothetical protein